MLKSLIIVTAALGVMLNPCAAQDQKEQKPDANPVVTKYDKMEKSELKEALKNLQKQVLVAERAAKQAKEIASEAAAAYESACDKEKPDALLRMIEADAASRKPLERYREVRSDFEMAKRAYLNMLLAAPANAEQTPAASESAKLHGMGNVTILEVGPYRTTTTVSPADQQQCYTVAFTIHEKGKDGKDVLGSAPTMSLPVGEEGFMEVGKKEEGGIFCTALVNETAKSVEALTTVTVKDDGENIFNTCQKTVMKK